MMNRQWTDAFREEIHLFRNAIDDFDSEVIDRKTYKGLSGGLGSYAQRDPSRHMLRLRLPAGRLTMERLKFLAETVEQENICRIKLTACETIQLHDLSAAQVPFLMEKAIDCGIYTKGGGGDHPRNVMASPLSGVQPGEAFDVIPWAEAVTSYLLSVCRDIHMPRKLKIAFCNGADDSVHSAFRDMGFLAQPDGTFSLRIAGGLGASSPAMGILAEEHLAPRDVLYYVRAMVDTFCAHGNYENRARARTRFLQDTLGPDGLRDEFLKQAERLKAAGGLRITHLEAPADIEKADGGRLAHPRALPQKQDGLYAVKYHPIGGLLPKEKPRQLYELLKPMKGAEIRIAPDETLYIINLNSAEARAVLAATGDGAQTAFEHSVSCIGAAVCQQGILNSPAVLEACVTAVRRAGIPDGCLPRIRISGCPSSCAAHQAADIGLQGCVKKTDQTPLPAFRLFAGGSDRLGAAAFGKDCAVLLERDLPSFFADLGKTVQASGQCWEEWLPGHGQELRSLIARYS